MYVVDDCEDDGKLGSVDDRSTGLSAVDMSNVVVGSGR